MQTRPDIGLLQAVLRFPSTGNVDRVVEIESDRDSEETFQY